MKRLILLACAAALLGCSGNPKTTLLQPEVEMYQLIGPADLNYPSGQIEVQFGLRIENKSAETITLRQVEMTPVGIGGPYQIRRRLYHFNQDVQPNATQEVKFWARAEADGDAGAADANAPVSLRAVALFETPTGSFRKILMKTFTQRGRGPSAGQ